MVDGLKKFKCYGQARIANYGSLAWGYDNGLFQVDQKHCVFLKSTKEGEIDWMEIQLLIEGVPTI